MSRADLDLKVAAGIALVALLAATAIDTAVVRTLPSVLLVLVVPGYALSVALLPDKRDIFERCLLALGLSLCIDVIGGLLIDRMGVGLTSRSWSVGLALVTLASCAVARHRRLTAGEPVPAQTSSTRREIRTSRRTLVTATMIVASLGAVIGAVLVARLPSSSAHIQGFTALWIKPVNPATGTFTVGVRSDERQTTSFRLVTTSATSHRVLMRRNLTLAPGRQWEARGSVVVPPDGTRQEVRVSLYRRGRVAVAYRQVYASFGTTGP